MDTVKKFGVPMMVLQKLETEEFMRTSGCYQMYECEDCYCAVVFCDDAFSCTGLKCEFYDHYE